MENKNIALANFAAELTELTGQSIILENIHSTNENRFYYTQAPKAGAPMLLHHYRGPFCIDIHPDDYKSIASGKVSAHDYIASANWQVGYCWGGGSMVGGGYYQPIDIIGRKDEVRRYLKILSCRGHLRSSGYMPTEDACNNCPVNNCPFSKFKQDGSWDSELQEPDPREDLFNALCKRFEQENPGYTLRGFLCGKIPEKEVWISANLHFREEDPFSFTASVSNSVIQSLLMHKTVPENWDEYANGFHFRIQTYEVTPEALKKAFEGINYAAKKAEKPEDEDDISERKVPLMTRLLHFFGKSF